MCSTIVYNQFKYLAMRRHHGLYFLTILTKGEQLCMKRDFLPRPFLILLRCVNGQKPGILSSITQRNSTEGWVLPFQYLAAVILRAVTEVNNTVLFLPGESRIVWSSIKIIWGKMECTFGLLLLLSFYLSCFKWGAVLISVLDEG